MKKFSAKEILSPTISLFVIALVVTLLLAITNSVTAPMIVERAKEDEINTRKTVLTEAADFKDAKIGENDYCIGLNAEGKAVGYIFITESKGYGGAIKVMTGVSADGKIAGVETLQISETAGLGMNAQRDGFRKQYIGKSGEIAVSKNSPDENEIQALTGATITSKAVTSAVNDALKLYSEVVKNG